MKSRLPMMIGFLLPCTQVSSCASVGLLGMLDVSAVETTSPTIQSATAVMPSCASVMRFFIGWSPFRLGEDGADLATGVEGDTERGEREHEHDARRNDQVAPQPLHAVTAAGTGAAGT